MSDQLLKRANEIHMTMEADCGASPCEYARPWAKSLAESEITIKGLSGDLQRAVGVFRLLVENRRPIMQETESGRGRSGYIVPEEAMKHVREVYESFLPTEQPQPEEATNETQEQTTEQA